MAKKQNVQKKRADGGPIIPMIPQVPQQEGDEIFIPSHTEIYLTNDALVSPLHIPDDLLQRIDRHRGWTIPRFWDDRLIPVLPDATLQAGESYWLASSAAMYSQMSVPQSTRLSEASLIDSSDKIREQLGAAAREIAARVGAALDRVLLTGYGPRTDRPSNVLLDDLGMLLLENITLLEDEKNALQDDQQRCLNHQRRDAINTEIRRLKRDLLDVAVHLVRYPHDPVSREAVWHLPIMEDLHRQLQRVSLFREERMNGIEGFVADSLLHDYHREVDRRANAARLTAMMRSEYQAFASFRGYGAHAHGPFVPPSVS